MDFTKDKKKYEMMKYSACGAKTRPHYCKYETNMCCFGCDKNEECMEYAKITKSMRPCGTEHFKQLEVCEWTL